MGVCSGKIKFSVLVLLALALVLGVATLAVKASETARSVMLRIKGEDGSAAQAVKLYSASYALLIGVSHYTMGWPTLPGVIRDLEDVKNELERQGFVVVVLPDPDSVHLKAGIEDFINNYGFDPENRVLIYFAGHGHTEKTSYGSETGYIVPADAPLPRDKKNFCAKAISVRTFETYAKNIQAKHALFLFDSCFSGAIFAINRAVPEIISYKTTKAVRQFLTAGAADEKVPDESIFKSQFIAGIKGEADSDGDGYVTGTELANFVESRVVRYSKGCQHPQYGTIKDPNLDRGDFVFQCGKEKVEEPPAKAYEPNMPILNKVDLSGLKKVSGNKSDNDNEAKGKDMLAWADWQGKFQVQFDEAKELENDPHVSAALKKKAWEQVLFSFAQENPYREDDEKMRSYAEERISALDAKVSEEERLAEERRQAEEERQAQAEARRQKAARKEASRTKQAAMVTITQEDLHEIFVHPVLGLTMRVPSGWTTDTSGANQIAVKLDNWTISKNAHPVITVMLSRAGTMTLDEYRYFNWNDLKKNPTLHMIREQAVTIAKTKWYKMIFGFPQGTANMVASSFYTIKKGIVYNITYAAPLSLYSQCYASAERIINSFTFPTKKI